MSFMNDLINRKYDISEEISTINDIITCLVDVEYKERYIALNIENIANFKIKDWKHRANFISIKQLKDKMGITGLIDRAKSHSFNMQIDDFIKYAEYVLNICSLCDCDELNENIKLAIQNIKNVVEYYNHSIVHLDKEDYYVIIPKSYEVPLAVEIVKEVNLCDDILKYSHYKMKGDIYQKSIILSRLFMYYEHNLEKKIKNINSNLNHEITEMSNKLKIRHDKPESKESIVVSNMTDEELEYWYDQIFALYLRAIILVENLKVRPDLEKLRKRLNEI